MIQSNPLPSPVLRSQVADVAPWTKEGDWVVLFGGRTNSAWKVSCGGRHLVLKLYRASNSNPMFPNDANAEALMLRHLSGLEIAPELLAEFESAEGHCTLYYAIPGTPWRQDVTSVARLMQRLHSLPVPDGVRSVRNGGDDVLAHGDEMLSLCTTPSALSELRPDVHVPATSDRVLLHCDMVPGNLISRNGKLHLIDWQCPGVGDACEDMAVFLSPAMQLLYRGEVLSTVETESFLASYSAQADRYRALAPAYHYRMAAYCAWKVETGVPDYESGLLAEIAALENCLR